MGLPAQYSHIMRLYSTSQVQNYSVYVHTRNRADYLKIRGKESFKTGIARRMKNNKKRLIAFARAVANSSELVTTLTKEDHTRTAFPRESANCFVEYFNTAYRPLFYIFPHLTQHPPRMRATMISATLTASVLSKLDQHKSPAPMASMLIC